jgi:hypothetical protein
MNPAANSNGAVGAATSAAPKTEVNKASVPENGDGRKCQPELLATSWQERLAAFPAELRDKDIWCVWRPEERDGKLTKVPCAKSNDPTTWASFKEACAIADRNKGYGVGGSGASRATGAAGLGRLFKQFVLEAAPQLC